MNFRNFKNWFGFKWTVKIKRMINYRKIWFLLNDYSAAGDQKWARGQLKYDGFPVSLVRKMMWSPKKTKKVFTEILTVFPVEIRCSQKKKKKKKVFRLHMLISQCHFDGPPLELMGPLKPKAFLKPMGPLKSMGPEVILPLPPLSAALNGCNNNYLLVIYCLK